MRMPRLGFGTWQLGRDTQPMVEQALALGVRHIDTAQMYGNEDAVGAAIAASGVARDELFVTTKLDNGNHAPDDARRTVDASLDRLGLDAVDLMLVHWPVEWERMERDHRRPRRGPCRRPHPLPGRVQLRRRPAGPGRALGAAVVPAGRVPPVPGPGRAAPLVPGPRLGVHRLLAAGQGGGRR